MDTSLPPNTPIYGLLAEFETEHDIIAAARRTHEAGYRRVDAYSPFPIEELSEAIGMRRTWVPLVVLGGGLTGLVLSFGMLYYSLVIDYPLIVGGRPLFSWPLFIPIMFETTVLFSAFGAFVGMLAMNGLPMPYHPVFNVPRFDQASQDRYFLLIESRDPRFDYNRTRRFLQNLGASSVSDVPA